MSGCADSPCFEERNRQNSPTEALCDVSTATTNATRVVLGRRENKVEKTRKNV